MAKGRQGREEEEKERDDIHDDDGTSSSSSSSSGSSSGSDTDTDTDSDTSSDSSSGSSSSSSSESGSGSGSDDDGREESEDENFEVGFWDSLKAVLPWTEAGREADYAEERLDAHHEFQEELDEALRIRKMVETGLHDTALERLMASTEGQMYHHFHKHRYELEQTGEWSFVPPSVKRRWRHADKKTDKVEKLRKYMAMRRDRFLRIRGLCRQLRSAHGRSSDLVVTVLPESLINENLVKIAGGGKKHKPAATFGGMRLKKCHWQGTNSKGEQCTCTNYRMEHPHRVFKDDLGVLIHDTLATCGWHATRCVSDTHGDDPVVVSTANEGALCNECLVQLIKGPIRHTTAFAAPGVRFKNRRSGTADTDGGGEEFLAWNKWFTKGPGRARKRAIRLRHPQAPPGFPPAGLRPPAQYVPPPPPPPVFSMANLRRQKKLAKWKLRKEERGSWAATAVQRTYRGYRARHLRTMIALEHPLRAQLRVESSIVMQSLVRRFLARVLVCQIAAFRSVNATAIQRMIRGMQARAVFRRKKAKALVQRQMLFFLTRAFVASAKVARRIREEMRKKHAVALSLQRAWRGRKGREKAAVLRAIVLRRQGAAITTQKAWRCFLAKRELEARQKAHRKEMRAATVMQSVLRMSMEKRRVKRLRRQLDGAARTLQPLIRGLLARRLARREKVLLGRVWGWLGTNSVTANEIYARFLPKNTYSVSTDEGFKQRLIFTPLSASGATETDGGGSRQVSGARELSAPSSLSRMSLETLPGERHFTEKFDKDRTGTCSKVEFKIGLDSFLREAGYALQKEEAALIVTRYFDGDGFCAWHSFLNSYYAAGSKGGACARHGRLLCTLCIRRGRCDKPGCACTKAKAGRSKQLGFKMCQCGHVFDAHALVVGGSNPAKPLASRQRGWVLPQKQLNSLLSKGLPKAAVDRPVNVEGCSAESTVQAPHGDTTPGGAGGRESTPPMASTNINRFRKASRYPYPARRGNAAADEFGPELDVGKVTVNVNVKGKGTGEGGGGGEEYRGGAALSLAEPGRAALISSPPSRSRQDAMGLRLDREEMATTRRASEGPSRGDRSTSPQKRDAASLPTLREAKDREKDRRDASSAGRRGQAERAALAEMTSSVQGRNAADYAARLQDDIAANASVVDGRLSLAPVMSKKELRVGFAISAAVPFVKAGTLKATTDPVGLYLYLLKAFSDERHELLEDDRRFTDFVARHAVFLERHWCKLVKDIRDGATDPHLPITEAKRMRVEGLMIPNTKRAQRLDDRLRDLGFHARASGVYKTAASAASSPATKAAQHSKSSTPSREGGDPATAAKRRRGGSAVCRRPLTQEEEQESMAKMVEACRKRRPGTAGGGGEVGQSDRRKRRTVTAGEMESTVRLLQSRGESRARSPSTGGVQATPTAEEASRTAYGLLTAASANAAGTVEAPSGRGVHKHVCLHPGCGKVFHLKASAARHQEKEHRFRRRLAAPTPLTDQFMSPAWPKDGVPWVPGSQSQPQRPSAAADTTIPEKSRRKPKHRAKRHPRSGSRRTASSPGRSSTGRTPAPTTVDAVLGPDSSGFQARFACGVPDCRQRFPEARLLALHLRMGHNDFDLERMKAAREGTGRASTLDGVSVTAPVDVGGHVRASFVGAYRLVPPFQSPTGCPAVPACAQHGRLKHGCRSCEEVDRQAAAAVAAGPGGTRLPLGAPLPPAKFYTRAMVVVSHHGRPTKLDLDCSQSLRCPLLSFPRHIADGSANGIAHQHQMAPCRTENELDGDGDGDGDGDDDDDDDDDEAMERTQERHVGRPAADDNSIHNLDMKGVPSITPRMENDLPARSAGVGVGVGVDAGSGAMEDNDENEYSDEELRRENSEAPDRGENSHHDPSTGAARSGIAANIHNENGRENADGVIGRNRRHQHESHRPRQQHHGGLVPVQLVAILVDGSGKGWLAARRLWSVGEVGLQALSEAGLASGDVDADQEFFVGTEVEYLPMSLVRDTCGVKVDRKDDVLSKQRLGDLPKPLRYVSHGIDSATRAVLLESELKRREERILAGGSS